MSSNSIYLRYLVKEDAAALLDIKIRNHPFFQPFEPVRDASHFTLAAQEQEIVSGIEAMANDQSYTFGIFLQATDELIGRAALTGIARGPFQNAYLGYFVDQQHNGKGYATAAVSLCVEKAFNELGLHRVQAGVMPRNTPSIRVLEKAGFRHEGLAQQYLKINGAWEDHALFAILSSDR
ncbi:GNAT family N-acetyltransferase [Paenibacillus gorillae]|uniref:GNAT family N-acetyltransferase n=1 Tax=Paenibacillus gorillae TaxID=1243662 RepID=UPI0004B55156|nr:GNAT family protein [Paenibacillus gorillae]